MKNGVNRALAAEKNLTFLSNQTKNETIHSGNRLDKVSIMWPKIATAFCILFTLGIGNMWGATATFTATGAHTSEADCSLTVDDITITWHGTDNTDIRVFKGQSLTITSSSGNITSLSFTFTSGSYNGGWNGNTASYSVTGLSTTSWSKTATSGNSGKQARITELVVTYEASASPVDPTITFNNGTYNLDGYALDLTTLFSSNSSGAVTYSVTNANGTGATCTSAGSFTATTEGTCTVQASQAAASGYNAKTATATITVQACPDLLTVNIAAASHGSFIVHHGNNASAPTVSNGQTIPNCKQVPLFIEATPDPGYEVGSYNSSLLPSVTAGNIFTYFNGNGSRSTTISVTFVQACSTPTISFPAAAITKYMGDGKFTFAPTITGNDLEAELTYSSNKTDKATVDTNTGEVTILDATGNGSPVTITATLSSVEDGGDCQREVSASYTLTIYNHVTWLVNGEPTTDGSPTISATEGAGITGLPTAPDGDEVCGGKTFVGWTTSTYSGDAAPTPLYTSVDDMSSVHITDNTTYYAVFAESSGGGGGGSSDYVLVESDLGTAWAGDYLIAYSSSVFADGRTGGTSGIGAASSSVDPGANLSGKVVAASWGDTYHVTLEEISSGSNTYLLKTQDNVYNYYTNNTNNGLTTTTNRSTADDYPITVTFTSATDIALCLGGAATGSKFHYNASAYMFRYYKNGGQSEVYLYKKGSGGGGSSYSDYSTTCGNCLAAPEPVVTVRTDNAIISWAAVEGATSYTVTCSGGTVTVSGTSATITGLTPETAYTYTIQSVGPNPPYDCFKTKNGSFTTPGADIDIVEWQENAAVIYVDKESGVDPLVIIDGEVEHGSISGAIATDLFFSKYFEGAGDMKLVAIFNGTGQDISLANYSLYTKNCSAPKKEADIATSAFGSTTDYPISTLGTIKAGQEIVFFSRPSDGDDQAALRSCSNSFLDAMAAKSGASENPRWIECGGGSSFPAMQFNGNDAICLEKNSTLIDVIGSTGDPGKVKNCANRLNDLGWAINVKNIDYGKASDDSSFDYLYEASSKPHDTDEQRQAILAAFGIDLSNEYIDMTTARCILFRDKNITSGECAVALNTGATFATCNDHICGGDSYNSEWNGRAVCMDADMKTAAGVDDDSKATCNSYQDLGEFDYNNYYKEYTNISDDQHLSDYTKDETTGEYVIPIANLSNYACLSLRFQLKDGEDVIAENAVQVPIIVKGTKSTTDAIFNAIVVDKETHVIQYNKSIERCQTCNVVVLGNAVLTKASGTASELETAHDVPRVRDLKVYPGGKVVVPSGTTYNVHSLALRRQEDEIPLADLNGTLNIGATNGVSLDLRIDPTNWHYITLPYDCNVDDVTFSDGETATLGTDWLCAWYDGGYRAEHKDGGWTDVTAGATLKKGLGYIVSLPGAGKVRKELRFPMANGVIADEKTSKTVTPVYGYGCTTSDDVLTPNHKGWNLIGNPYMMYYASDLDSPLDVGELIPNGNTYKREGSLKYLVTPNVDDNGASGWSGYSQVAIDTHMKPFTAYFVQIGGSNPATAQDISFNQSSAGKNSIVRRRDVVAETDDMHPIWYGIEMVAPNGEKDNTALLISDEFTDNYDMMDDLVKLRGSYYQYYNLPVLATRNNKEELAFNALPDNSAAVTGVPVNFYAAEAGEYTISTDGRYDLGEVKEAKLFDATTNQYYDLLADNYTFTANKGNNTERFRLFVTVDRNKVPTDNNLPTLADVALTTIGNTLVLSGLSEASNIYVYDMSGKLMQSAHANGNGEIWRTNVPATGVYFVRVNNQNGQQTLRAVVK